MIELNPNYINSRKGVKLSDVERERISMFEKEQYASGKKKVWNENLTKDTSEKVRKAAEKMSIIKTRLFAEGKLIPPNKNKKMSEEQKKKVSIGVIKHFDKVGRKEKIIKLKKGSIELSKKLSEAFKKFHAEHPEERDRMIERSNKWYAEHPEYVEDCRKRLLKNWADPDFSEKRTKAILNGSRKRPTSFEQQIIDLNSKYNLGLEYVGNGGFMIGRKNPDFICADGRKIAIEVYAEFWHSPPYDIPDYEINREKFFEEHGFKVLFLNQKDLLVKDWEQICLSKIKNFLEAK